MGRSAAFRRELARVVRRLRRIALVLVVLAPLGTAAAALVVAHGADRDVAELRRALHASRTDVAEVRRRHSTSVTRLDELRRRLDAISHPLYASLAWPVDGAVLSGYGPRGCCSTHPGIDLDAPDDSAVRAAAAGVVVAAGWESGYGNRVIVDHGRGLTTLYAHLDSLDVSVPALVTRASQLGTVGCTGTCYGTHLHFEVRLRGETSDPEFWLPDQREDVALLQFGG